MSDPEYSVQPTNDDGEPIERPVKYGVWELYPSGRIVHGPSGATYFDDDRVMRQDFDVDEGHAESFSAEKLLHTRDIVYTTDEGTFRQDISKYSNGATALDNLLDTLASQTDYSGDGPDVDIFLPLRAMSIANTLDVDAGRFGAIKIRSRTGMVEEVYEGAYFNSTITNGSDVLTTSTINDTYSLEDIHVHGSGNDGAGIVWKGEDLGYAKRLSVADVGGIGIDLAAGETRVTGIRSIDAGAQGVRLDGNITVQGVEVERAGGIGIDIRSGERMVLQPPIIAENGADYGLFIGGTLVQVYCPVLTNNLYGLVTSGKGLQLDSLIWGAETIDNDNGGAVIRDHGVTLKNCKFDENVSGSTHLQLQANDLIVDNCRFLGTSQNYNIKSGSRIVITRSPTPNTSNINGSVTDMYVDDPNFNGEQAANPGSSTYTLSFDTAFTHYPRIDLTADAAVNSYSNWTTDANGNYVSVDVTFGSTPSQVTWEAIPRNVGV